MSPQRRGTDRVDLDHAGWVADDQPARRGTRPDRQVEDPPAVRRPSGGRSGSERRVAPRHAGSSTAQDAVGRSTADRRGPSGGATSPPRPPETYAPRRRSPATPSGSRRRASSLIPAPGVTERRTLLLVTFLLVLYGLVMAYSASSAQAYFEYHSSFYFVKRQIMWVVLGMVVMWVLSRVDYAWWRRAAVPLFGLVLLGLAAVLVPGIGSVVNGARRWIIIGGQGLQPSELAKLAAVVLVATLIVRRPRDIDTPRGFLRLAGIGIIPAALLIMLEPDLGTTIVLVVAVVAVLIAAGARLRYLFLALVAGCLGVLAMIAVEPYRLQRLVTFFDPWKDPQGSGFQATQSLISIASGHIFGVGLGNSVQKFGFLPEQGTDMITGIIGEELGLAGLVVLLALYVALAWACFRIALSCRDLFGKLLATGITAIVIGQACINVGAALGLLPLTGVPLPLVSLGGTNIVVVFAGLGVLLNVATNRRSFIVVSPERGERPRSARSRGPARAASAARTRSARI